MNKIKTKDLVKTLLSEGTVIKRDYNLKFMIVEAFGQRFRIENPSGKGVKITQIERTEQCI